MASGSTEIDRFESIRIIGSRGGPSRAIVRLLELSPFVFAGIAVVIFVPASWTMRLIGLTVIGGLAIFRAVAEIRSYPDWIQTVMPVLIAISIGIFTAISESSLLNTLALFNCLRVAFADTRRTLIYTLAATAVALIVPALIHPDALGVRAIIWLVVLPAICFPIQNRSETVRARIGLNAKLAAVLADLLTSDNARRSIVNAAHELGDADIAVIFERTRDGDIRAAAAYGADTDQILVLPDDSSAIGMSLTNREIVFAPFVESVDLDLPPGFADRGIKSLISCPIMRDGEAIAALCVGWTKRVRRGDRVDPTVVKILAAEAAATIDHSDLLLQLVDTAATDPLTGLPNRRAWDRLLQTGLLESRQVEKPLSIAILDLDHFKRFNDSRGHQAGDRLLREAAAAWKDALRKDDMIFRWGGEEFTVILPHCDREQSIEVAERLRSATPGDQTSSAGVSTWNGSESAESLFARTDAALYQAKESGRDQTVTSGNPSN
ncbi:MAG TPA: sensor domain-containing diguanylate cyclase [Solirubrobacterales bacterium]|nr:sensor domain-containing diguanylate cyclase [Solirubrobacterales bacterium]